MPRAPPHIALVLDLPGAFGLGFVQNGLRPALELTRTLVVLFPSVVARAAGLQAAGELSASLGSWRS
jgi:hypothetical protein